MLKEEIREELLCCYNKEVSKEDFRNDFLLYDTPIKRIYDLLSIIDSIDFNNDVEVEQYQAKVKAICGCSNTTTITTTRYTTTLSNSCGLGITSISISNGQQRALNIIYNGFYPYDFIDVEILKDNEIVYFQSGFAINSNIIIILPYSIYGNVIVRIGKFNCKASYSINLIDKNTTTTITTTSTTSTSTTTLTTTRRIFTTTNTTTGTSTTTCNPNIEGEGGCGSTSSSTTLTTTIPGNWQTIGTYYKCDEQS